MRTIQSKWEGYRSVVVDGMDLPPDQLERLRNAFYAGAGGTLAIVLRMPEEGLRDEAAGAILNGLTAELNLHVLELFDR